MKTEWKICIVGLIVTAILSIPDWLPVFGVDPESFGGDLLKILSNIPSYMAFAMGAVLVFVMRPRKSEPANTGKGIDSAAAICKQNKTMGSTDVAVAKSEPVRSPSGKLNANASALDSMSSAMKAAILAAYDDRPNYVPFGEHKEIVLGSLRQGDGVFVRGSMWFMGQPTEPVDEYQLTKQWFEYVDNEEVLKKLRCQAGKPDTDTFTPISSEEIAALFKPTSSSEVPSGMIATLESTASAIETSMSKGARK